jgi:hypothetical protein
MIDKRSAKAAIVNLYNYCHQKSQNSTFAAPSRNPKVVFVDGPTELYNNISDEEPIDLTCFNSIVHFVNKGGYGSRERVHSVICQVFSKRDGKSLDFPMFCPVDYMYNIDRATEWEKLASAVWDQTYICFTFKDVCYVVERPLLVKSNERGLHCSDGPAIVFRDGTEIYCYEGILTTESNVLHPDKMTLKDIHQHNSRKHILIDLCGVDRYLDLCKSWRPDVKGKFQKFFGMSNIVNSNMYVNNPYSVKFSHRNVNCKYALRLDDNYDLYAFWKSKHVFDWDHSSKIFDESDRELWDLLDVGEVFSRGAVMGFTVSFQKGIFSVDSATYSGFKTCSHDVAPSWFKAKMFRGQDALYENNELNYCIKYEEGQLLYAGDIELGSSYTTRNESSKPLKVRNSLFSGCENIPSYKFDIDIQSDSWEGLLEKWATLSFNWLGMHEDSTRMP